MKTATDRFLIVTEFPITPDVEPFLPVFTRPQGHSFFKEGETLQKVYCTFCREILGSHVTYNNTVLDIGAPNWVTRVYAAKSDIKELPDLKLLIGKLRRYVGFSAGLIFGMEEIIYNRSRKLVPYFQFSREVTGQMSGFTVSYLSLLIETKSLMDALMEATSKEDFIAKLLQLNIPTVTEFNKIMLALFTLGYTYGRLCLDGLSGPSRTAEYFSDPYLWNALFSMCSEAQLNQIEQSSSRGRAYLALYRSHK